MYIRLQMAGIGARRSSEAICRHLCVVPDNALVICQSVPKRCQAEDIWSGLFYLW